jgi:precorrin-2 C20-methyltransferase/precorrin-3B C17-methyltransferase
MTAEVAAALAEVDHVVGYGPYLDRLPARPRLRRHPSGNTVEVERARYALDLALAGESAAVVSSGDAGVFGMAAAVFEAAEEDRYAGIKITVLPGVTAAQAVAARAGAPLGGDYAVVSLSDRLKPWSVIERRLRAVAEADLVLAIYNPASRTRREQIVRARELLLELRPSDTPVVVGRNVGRDGEDLIVTTLEALEPATIDMSCLLIIGSSQTRLGHGATVWTSRSHTS